MRRHPHLAAAVTFALAGGSALSVGMVAPSTASASCSPRTAVSQLARADVAFVGRLTEQRADRLIFTVDQALKGSPGATVEIPRGPLSSVSLDPEPGEAIGLTARRSDDGTLAASDCDRSAPANLQAAADAPGTDCTPPQVRTIKALEAGRVGEPARFRVRLTGAKGRLDRLRIDWGDGSAKTYRVDADSADPSLTSRHRFRRPGLRRVSVTASAGPSLACGVFGMPPRASSPEHTLRVRVRRD